MKLIYSDDQLVVCVKPPRVLSTDEPGGLPDLLREAFQTPGGDFRTVHRLDRVVGGLMVVARTPEAAGELSRQIRENVFHKAYLAVAHGNLPNKGTMEDLLGRDPVRRITYVAEAPGKGIQNAVLHYVTRKKRTGLSLVQIQLVTGRTHQIRAQFSDRGFPLVGDRKYGTTEDGCEIALWSYLLRFCHPVTGKEMTFTENPPMEQPWKWFADQFRAKEAVEEGSEQG